MNVKTKEIYSEVYGILILMGDRFISKLPNKLFNLIKSERLETYNPQYNLDLPLEEQNVREETIDVIALLYFNYWCDSEEEKKELSRIWEENEEKYQKQLNEKYNINNLFKDKKIEIKEEIFLIEHKKNFFEKIIDKIKQILKIH